MNATIDIDHKVIDEMGVTVDQFQEAVVNALRNLACPMTGNPLYFNGVQVTVIADCPEILAV